MPRPPTNVPPSPGRRRAPQSQRPSVSQCASRCQNTGTRGGRVAAEAGKIAASAASTDRTSLCRRVALLVARMDDVRYPSRQRSILGRREHGFGRRALYRLRAMFTATRDLVLPTTVTGSWPRPRWYTGRLGGRSLTTAMKDVVYREQLSDALATLLGDQERAGLDILTHGDYFHDEDLGGHSWHRYPLERWAGLAGDYRDVGRPDGGLADTYPAGTILHEVFGGWAWPRVVGKVEPNEDAPLEYAKLWRLAQARTRKPVKFGTVSAQGFHPFLDVRTDHSA